MIIMPVHTFYMKLIQLFLYLIGLPVDLPQVCWGQVTSLQLLDVKKGNTGDWPQLFIICIKTAPSVLMFHTILLNGNFLLLKQSSPLVS